MNENDTSARTMLSFIPIGRVVADPVELGSAVSLALYNRPSADATLWQGPNGETVIEVYNPRTKQLESFRPGDDHGPAQEYTIMMVHGGAVITRAIREGTIEAFIIDAAGRYLRVPRLYWLQANPSTDTSIIQTGHIPDELVGCPVLVDPTHIPKWREVARPEVDAMLSRIRNQRGENVLLHPKTRNSGPDPYKEYPMLEAVFKVHHAKLADCDSDRARMQALTGIWRGLDKRKTGRDTCPSKAVVKRCWERYVTTRH